jgi:hypothetical protein
MITKRKVNDQPKPIQKGVNFIRITKKVNLVGSSSIKELHYIQDYDLNEMLKTDTITPTHILRIFQEKYKDALHNKSIIITDFKMSGKKWDAKDIMNGYIMKNKKRMAFEDLFFSKKDIMKMDIIYIHPDKKTDRNNRCL